MGNGRIVKTHWYRRRWEVLLRDNFTCRYCGQYAPNVQLEVDHVKPTVEGGTDDAENLVTSCWSCNRGKEGYRASVASLGLAMPISPPVRHRRIPVRQSVQAKTDPEDAPGVSERARDFILSSRSPFTKYDVGLYTDCSTRTAEYVLAALQREGKVNAVGKVGRIRLWQATGAVT